MNKCINCNQDNLKDNFFCSKCIKNPFCIEKGRQNLAKDRKIHELRKIYLRNYKEIIDLNTQNFWNFKFSTKETLRDQDGMTKDRIKTAFSFFDKDIKKVLDIGVGLGFIEEILSKIPGVELYGNDISDDAIKNISKKIIGHFVVESIYEMRYQNNSFNTILCLEVLEHVPPSKTFQLLKKIKSYLKPNGIFILSVPMNEGLEKMNFNPNGHVRDYTEDLISAELELSGFKILNKRKLYAFKDLYVFKKNLSKLLFWKWKPNNIIIKAISI